jgi:hypothetical protein
MCLQENQNSIQMKAHQHRGSIFLNEMEVNLEIVRGSLHLSLRKWDNHMSSMTQKYIGQ